MKNKINTLIAVVVALGVVWLWNAGFFAGVSRTNSINQPAVNSQGANISDNGASEQFIPQLE